MSEGAPDKCGDESPRQQDAGRADLPATGFCQPPKIPKGELIWPILDSQRPEIVHSVTDFLEAMLFQPHLDRVVVLPNGIDLLGQTHSIPEVLRKACVTASRSRPSKEGNAACERSPVRCFLDALGGAQLERFRGRIWQYGTRSKEKEVKKKGIGKALKEVVDVLQSEEDAGNVSKDAPLYISELRWLNKVPHPLVQEETVKTATSCDIYDFTALARRMPLWERSECGIFVGERGTGSGMHTDQCLWSNVGRNWCGYKLFAIWPWEERISIPKELGKGRIFHLPLTKEEEGWLNRAKVIALVKPGDVWVFSGGQPHTALVVGDGLNISAYESLVPACAEAVELLVSSNTKRAHWENCWMDDDDLDELYEDVTDNLQRSLRDPGIDERLRGRLEESVKAMREKGDSYCRDLWAQEDRGERRRQREEESGSESPAPGGDAVEAPKAKRPKAEEPRDRTEEQPEMQ